MMMPKATRRSSFHNNESSPSPIMDVSPRTVITKTIMGVARSPRITTTTTTPGGGKQQRRTYSLDQLLWGSSSGGSGSNASQSSSYYGCTQLGIQLSDITILLQEVIPKFASRNNNRELVRLSKSHCQRITSQISAAAAAAANETINAASAAGGVDSAANGGWSGPDATELEDIVSVLTQFLDSITDLPPSLVASIHTTIGLIRQKQRFYDSSIESLQKALWIKNSAKERPEEIAIALHRLGLAYGRKGEKSLASTVLDRAVRKYVDDAHWSKNHPLVVSAKGKAERYSSSASAQGKHKGSASSSSNNSRSPVPYSSGGGGTAAADAVAARRRATTHSPATRAVLVASTKDWTSLPAIPNLR